MRVLVAIAVLACAALVVGGCGGRDDSTPVACLEGSEAYLSALEAAPGEVRLDGETPISGCLVAAQQGGDQAAVGAAMVEAATALNAEAREDPGSGADLRLGYLIGAAEKGASDTSGIHADLLRRLAVAARFAPDREPLSATFREAYEEGFDAGRADG